MLKEEKIEKFCNTLLNKDISSIKEKEFQNLKELLLNLDYFKRMEKEYEANNKNLLSKTIKKIRFKKYKQKEIIWDINEEINEVYIIITGSVNIYKIKNKEKVFDYKLTSGNLIGEESLLYRSRYRTNILESNTECILATIEINEYYEIYEDILSNEKQKMSYFLKDLNYFPHTYFIEKLQPYLIKKFYHKNDKIYTQFDNFKTIYIVIKGEVNLKMYNKSTTRSLIDYNLLVGNIKKITRFTSSRVYELKGSYKHQNNYNLINLKRGAILGGIEFYNNYLYYLHTATCLTDVTLYEFDIDYFQHFKNSKVAENFKNKINEQKLFLESRIESINKESKNSLINKIVNQNKFTKIFMDSHSILKEYNKNKYLIENSCRYIKSNSNFFEPRLVPQNTKELKNIKSKNFKEIFQKIINKSPKINKYKKIKPYRCNSAFIKENKKDEFKNIKLKFLMINELIKESSFAEDANFSSCENSLNYNTSISNIKTDRFKLNKKLFINNHKSTINIKKPTNLDSALSPFLLIKHKKKTTINTSLCSYNKNNSFRFSGSLKKKFFKNVVPSS